MNKTRGWWWKIHGGNYTKSSVKDAEDFVGWPTLMELIKECERTEYKPSPVWPPDSPYAQEYRARLVRRDQAIIAALFLTGGRVNEVVPLRKANFEIHPRSLHVKNMRVLKHYKKTGSYMDQDGKKRYITEPVEMTRGTIAIQLKEPLVPILTSWLAEVDDYLFESPAKNRSHISGNWAYKIVRKVGRRRGLEVWPHWFRSQRASQLVVEWKFDIHKLADWFKWTKIDTARIYTKLSPDVYEDQYEKVLNERTIQEENVRLQRENDELRVLVAAQEVSE